MRKIKFRAWDKEEKKMLVEDDVDVFYCYSDLNGNIEHMQRTCELMQFTGLKDRLGIEIYEGDIVKSDVIGEVRWCDTQVGFVVLSKKWVDMLLVPKQFKVIGNIYENPELLEEDL